MQAIYVQRYGSPEVLTVRDIEKPRPKDNEVLVKISASAVTQADVMMRAGTPWFGRLFLGLRAPKAKVPGTAFAGTVEAVGKDVTRFGVGDDVFGETTIGFHAHAQYVAVPENGVIERLPSNMNYEEAASLPDGALTVHNFLTNLVTIKPGMKVLINGAAGGLGTSAVQLAKHLGAEVTAVASGRNEPLLRELGADVVIDYTKEDFTEGSERFDIIFDAVGKVPFRRARKALVDGGTYLSPVLGVKLLFQMMWTSRFSSRKAKFSATGLLPHEQLRVALGELKKLVEADAIWTVIDRRYALDEIAEAHRYVESGHKRGNVVIKVEHAALKLVEVA